MCFVSKKKYINVFSLKASNRKYLYFLQKIEHGNKGSTRKCSGDDDPKRKRFALHSTYLLIVTKKI